MREYEPGVIGIGSQPAFAIGQRALLVRTSGGNVLWDCIATLDAATVTAIKGLGGLKAIAISHPHFYTTMVRVGARLRLPDPSQRRRQGLDHAAGSRRSIYGKATRFKLWDGVTLIRCGGHFDGGSVLHWAGGAGGRGVVCAGDILTVTTDRKWLSFMRSYPNFIPLSQHEVEHIGAALAPFQVRRAVRPLFRPRDRARTPSRCWKNRSRAMWRRSTGQGGIEYARSRFPRRPRAGGDPAHLACAVDTGCPLSRAMSESWRDGEYSTLLPSRPCRRAA